MCKRQNNLGPSIDTDDGGDPINGDFGAKLSRDLAIERGQPAADIRAPAHVRKVWDAPVEDD